MRFLTESFFNSEVISNFSFSNLFNAFNELKQFCENSICVDHVWSSSHQSFFFKDLYIRWTYAHFFAVGLMKADVLRSDYMYSNDLIVLFLLTYFSIRGRRRLITDNVFFLSNVISSGTDCNSSCIKSIFCIQNMHIRPKKTDAMS